MRLAIMALILAFAVPACAQDSPDPTLPIKAQELEHRLVLAEHNVQELVRTLNKLADILNLQNDEIVSLRNEVSGLDSRMTNVELSLPTGENHGTYTFTTDVEGHESSHF